MTFWDQSAPSADAQLHKNDADQSEVSSPLNRKKRLEPEWKEGWHLSETGAPLPNLFNAMLALRKHPTLSSLLKYDDMARTPVLMQQIPGTPYDPAIPRMLKDADVLAIQEELQLTGLRRIAKATVEDAVRLRAEQQRFHPVLDYLNGLKWDGESRVRGWLGRYLGAVAQRDGEAYKRDPSAEDERVSNVQTYIDTIGELFLISMVARQFEPGCQADYMLILEGPQGNLKSTTCRVLGGEWFSDNLPDLSRGDAVRLSMHLRGKWLIEIAEMSSFNSAEANTLKEFLTQKEERYTPKYGRNEVKEARQCVFIGTTNEAVYLKDATGARRFWPVKTGNISIEDLIADRDQLLAEAVKLYREGKPWSPSREFEAKYIVPEQEARFVPDAWQEVFETWAAENAIRKCTVNEVLLQAVQIPLNQIGTREQNRVRSIFGVLKWSYGRSNGKTHYHRPIKPTESLSH